MGTKTTGLLAAACLALGGATAQAQDRAPPPAGSTDVRHLEKVYCFGEIDPPDCDITTIPPFREPAAPTDETPSTWNPYCMEGRGPIVGCTPRTVTPTLTPPLVPEVAEQKGFITRFLERVGHRVRGIYLQAKQINDDRRHRFQ